MRQLRAAGGIAGVAWRDIRNDVFGQVAPRRPTIVNLLVNDICNSKCQMCHIWGRKRDREITAAELGQILDDPLFRAVEYIGVSGGEPTLRRDLVALYGAIAAKSPRVRGTGIITNALRPKDVIDKIVASADVCRSAGIAFNAMVSLDGLGAVHDLVRGRPGNFTRAVEVIRHLRDRTDVPVSIGCTVTKDNVWDVDRVLDWCRAEGVYGRFRVAERIRRLYNDDQMEVIRTFDALESYHLGLFFAKLEATFEPSELIRRTYRNIRRMLMEDVGRTIACPWQANGVTLDCRGQLSYCAPRSPILGNCLDTPAEALYDRNTALRRRIIEEDCDTCIHDYHADETLQERIGKHVDAWWTAKLSLAAALKAAPREAARARPQPGTASSPLCIVVGWYGTETAGDKAILDEVVRQARARVPGTRIAVASLYPFVTQWTSRELGLGDVHIVPAYSRELWRLLAQATEVVVGGGPLMHIEPLGVLLWSLLRGRRHGARTRIAGSGIGPLAEGGAHREAVTWLLRLADDIELRDAASAGKARAWTGRADIRQGPDPSVAYVRRWAERQPATPRVPALNLFLREWTDEYAGSLDAADFKRVKVRFEEQLGGLVRALCARHALRPRFLPMHHFHVGNDDREFARRFAAQHLEGFAAEIEARPLSPEQLLARMREGSFNVCMRFHSVVFAHTLGAPFGAVDYTGGGKIRAFLDDAGSSGAMLDLREIADGAWQQGLERWSARIA